MDPEALLPKRAGFFHSSANRPALRSDGQRLSLRPLAIVSVSPSLLTGSSRRTFLLLTSPSYQAAPSSLLHLLASITFIIPFALAPQKTSLPHSLVLATSNPQRPSLLHSRHQLQSRQAFWRFAGAGHEHFTEWSKIPLRKHHLTRLHKKSSRQYSVMLLRR